MVTESNKSRTFLRGIRPTQKGLFNIHSSPQQAAGYSGKVRDKKERGFIIVLVACALSILLISLSIALPTRLRGLETSREFETRKELERIRAAIMGLPNEEFGFISDMGRLSNNLEELNTQGTQPSFHASDGGTPHHGSVGMGWRGPYYRYGTTNDDYLKDAWGRPYVYVITESVETAGGMTLNQRTARIISKGPDGIYPSSDDIYSEEIFQRANLILRVVKAFKDDIVQNVEATVYSSSNGEQTMVTSAPVTFPGVGGTEYAIPFYDLHHGIHSFKVNFGGASEETGYLHLVGGFANRYTIAIPVGPGGKGGGT